MLRRITADFMEEEEGEGMGCEVTVDSFSSSSFLAFVNLHRILRKKCRDGEGDCEVTVDSFYSSPLLTFINLHRILRKRGGKGVLRGRGGGWCRA